MHGIKGVSMTNTSTLTLDGVSFQLPDGSLLFSDLDETFDTRHTGLVGRNGVGKSLLARLLAGHLQPSSGSVRRQGRVRYLAQQLEPADYPTVADLAGVRPWLEALARIEAGSLDAADYECLGERWDIRQRLADALAAEGLGHLRADTPSERLSGGECMRVALLGAFLDDADFLILDEPSNPLDGPARALLRARLAAWDGGLLLVSHDRELLEGMQRIVELSTLGLRSYGGGYSFYAQSREEAREAAERRLDQRRLERKRQTLAMREQQQRQERRQASGRREGKTANQAKILLGGFRERSEVSAGKLRNAHQAERERLDREVREALFEHRQVQARGPAETFYPGQEAPGGDGRGLRVEQTREDLVVEDALGVQAVHHRLEIEQQAALRQGLVDPVVPVLAIVERRERGAVLARPGLGGLAFGLGQGLVGTGQEIRGRVAFGERADTEIGDRREIAGTGASKVLQAFAEFLGQAFGLLAGATGSQHGELAAAAAGQQPVGAPLLAAGVDQQAGDRLDQFIRALPAETLVEPVQVVQAQQQELPGMLVLAGTQLFVEAGVEQAPVGQAGETVLVGLGA